MISAQEAVLALSCVNGQCAQPTIAMSKVLGSSRGPQAGRTAHRHAIKLIGTRPIARNVGAGNDTPLRAIPMHLKVRGTTARLTDSPDVICRDCGDPMQENVPTAPPACGFLI